MIVQIAPRGVARAPFLIHAGQSISDARDVGGWDPLGVQLPTAWTTANLTFLAAERFNGTYLPVYGPTLTEARLTVGSQQRTILVVSGIADLRGLRYMKLRSGTEASPVVQLADRTVNMLVRQGA